MEETGKNVAPF